MKNTRKKAINTFFMTLVFCAVAVAINAAPPVNDFWSDGTVIQGTSGTVMGTVVEATTQSCELDHQFSDEAGTTAKNSVWYKFVVPANASYTFRISEATNLDPTLSAYRFAPGVCGGNVTQLPNRIIENHRYNYNLGLDGKSRISFRAVAGEVIYIAVDSFSNLEGPFSLSWEKTRYRYSAQLDYNNGGTDLSLTVTGAGQVTEWWNARYATNTSLGKYSVVTYGKWGDKRYLADYDGDGVSDIATIHPENGRFVWWIANRSGETLAVTPFGLATDDPLVGDYDGDGIADIAVSRVEASNVRTWHILRSSDGQYEAHEFATGNATPMVGDYDGDRKTDLVAIRLNLLAGNRTWLIRRSSDGVIVSRDFGKAFGDVPQAADFDNDGKTDIAVFRRDAGDPYTGYWFSLDSSSPLPLENVPTNFYAFGQAGDIPQAGDYDGDGKTDLAVFHWTTGEWWIRKSSNGQAIVYQFGQHGNIPRADTGIAAQFLDLNI